MMADLRNPSKQPTGYLFSVLALGNKKVVQLM